MYVFILLKYTLGLLAVNSYSVFSVCQFVYSVIKYMFDVIWCRVLVVVFQAVVFSWWSRFLSYEVRFMYLPIN